MSRTADLPHAPSRLQLSTLAILTTSLVFISSAGADGISMAAHGEFVERFCIDCHNTADRAGELDLERVGSESLDHRSVVWEKVVRKLRARQMPPIDATRPDEAEYEAFVQALETALDRAAEARPNPGRTDTLRRLTRTEYQHAIRDLLALDLDVSSMLPADESSHGFDNVTVGDLSPTLLNRYISAAQKISQLAVGITHRSPDGDTIRLPADFTQEEHVEGLPLGTRGGALINYHFPQDGEYDVQLRLARDRNEHVEGLNGRHELELLLDRQRVQLFTVEPPADPNDHTQVDGHLITRIAATAGPHQLGVTFLKQPSSLLETMRQPFQAHYNMHRHPRISPALYQISIIGPYAALGPGDTPSRRLIFGDLARYELVKSSSVGDQAEFAEQLLAHLIRRAYRRPVAPDDLVTPMNFFRAAQAEAGFDAGIELALSSILVNPYFLFRIEQAPPDIAPGTVYRIDDLELASRLSFFLWSSIPDEELLELASRGELGEPDVLRRQVRRMLADERSRALVSSFANQWLYLRNLDSITPDLRLFPDFDDNLRKAFQQETELCFEEIVREDRSVLELLKSDHTFLNERLAKHYGIPHVYGSRFRRVSLDEDNHRGGLLRHGSILTVTSYATRTSPVIRGHWILKNLLGAPPPPPPPNVPALKDNTVAADLSVRARLAVHRANEACASCHNLMDPVGFALENFDAVGRWRNVEAGQPVDASGGLPDGSTFDGVFGLEEALLRRPELFASTMTEKLLTYALGRGIEDFDAPAIRNIVRDAKSDNYRFSSLILGIATSPPFQLRKAS